jgi:hypothetical protein
MTFFECEIKSGTLSEPLSYTLSNVFLVDSYWVIFLQLVLSSGSGKLTMCQYSPKMSKRVNWVWVPVITKYIFFKCLFLATIQNIWIFQPAAQMGMWISKLPKHIQKCVKKAHAKWSRRTRSIEPIESVSSEWYWTWGTYWIFEHHHQLFAGWDV